MGDTETAPIAVEQDPVANAISEDGTEEEEPEIDASLPVSYTHLECVGYDVADNNAHFFLVRPYHNRFIR